jgi:hypothetical protein
VLAAALAAVAVAATPPKTTKGTTYASQSGGYALTVPATWKLIPRTVPQIKSAIAALKKQKKSKAEATALAGTLQSIIDSPAGVNGLKAYVIQAFAWPTDPNTPILTEASLGIVKTSRAYTKKDLPAIGAEYANSISANKGSKVLVPKIVTLPAGPAEFIEATVPAGTGLQNGIELYLIPHGKRLYELSFQVDGTLLAQATLFTSIAQKFKFLTK